jgi:hypothetical protein
VRVDLVGKIMEKGTELFVAPRLHRNRPLHWFMTTVDRRTQRFVYVKNPNLGGKRIPVEKLIDGAEINDGAANLVVWFPTANDRARYEAAEIRAELESKIIKVKWGNCSIAALKQILNVIEQDANT